MLSSRSDRVVGFATGDQFGKEIILRMSVILVGTFLPKVFWQVHLQTLITLAALAPETDGAMVSTGDPRQGKIPRTRA